MKIETLGKGDPEITVIGSLHGDEPCGKAAIEKFLSENWAVNKPVKFIIANEEALEQNKRFLESDLNRSFPGDSESDKYEERLAAKILAETEGTRVLDIHSTHSEPVPFATLSEINEGTKQLVSSTGVENAVVFPESSGTLNEHLEGIIVEVGKQGTREAEEMAYEILINFLGAEGVIDHSFKRSNPVFYRYSETVDGDWEFTARNFHKVEKGEVFAVKGEKQLRAEKDFYPALMSTNGYDGMLGFKTEKVGE